MKDDIYICAICKMARGDIICAACQEYWDDIVVMAKEVAAEGEHSRANP
jgi:hypothetical protein